MARTARTAAAFSAMFLASTFFCAPVWAQSQSADPALQQMAASMATMAAAMQRLAQGTPAAPPAQFALTHTAPASQVGPADYLTREEWSVFLAGDFSKVKRDIQSLKGRIAPRQDAPTATGPVASANSTTGPARVKMTAPAQEEYLSVGFSGDVPNQKDVDGISAYLGRYDVAQVIVLPAPGKDDTERRIHAAARDAALRVAYGGIPPGLRKPKDDGEAHDLVRGAPKDAGVVFHLTLKKTTTASTK